jgi:tetratricopeptide (TPR) repeat protein
MTISGVSAIRSFVAAASLLLIMSAAVEAAPAAARGADLEVQTRLRDMTAVQSYMASVAKLAVLAQQKQNTGLEAPILFRIAETLYKVAAIRFRVAHSFAGAAAPGTPAATPNFREYHAVLSQLTKTCSRIIERFPKYPELARAFYLRGQANKELGADGEAIRDFKHYIDNYPRKADLISAHMSLFDVFLKAEDYRSAITYHRRLEKAAQEQYYPLVLDHLALAHYSLGEVPEALHYLELELSAMPAAEVRPGAYSEREKVLRNAALYYFSAVNSGRADYTIGGAVGFFVRLKPGMLMSKVLAHFANLLRSSGRDDDLETLRKSVTAAGMSGVESAEVLFACLEVAANKLRFDRLKESSELLFTAASQTGVGSKTSERMQSILNEAASNVQRIFLKTKPGPEHALISAGLLSLYQAMHKVASTDAARQKIDLNIAETYFALKKHEIAAAYYRRVADAKVVDGEKIAALARLRSVASGYEAISEKGLIPKQLDVRSISTAAPAKMAPEVAQWIGWLDQYQAGKVHDPVDSYLFEAGRVVYASGAVEIAIDRLKALLAAYPASKHSIASSSLILDTYVASRKWDEAHQLAIDLMVAMTPTDPEKVAYRAKLLIVAGEAFFKTAEVMYEKADYEATIKRAEIFLKSYPLSTKKEACLALAGNAALALKDKPRAMVFLTPFLVDPNMRQDVRGVAMLTRAAIAEENWEFAAAASDYREYFKLPSKAWGLAPADLKALRSKALFWGWISGRSELLGAALGTPGVCPLEAADECFKYTALRTLADPAHRNDPKFGKRAFELIKKITGPSRVIWAVAALENYRNLSLNERSQVVDIVSAEWGAQDPLIKYALLSPISRTLGPALRQSGLELRELSKLKLDKAAIDRRTRLVAKLEGVVNKVVELPWARLRVAALGELGSVYADFARDLEALPAPAGLAGEDLAAFKQTIGELKAPFSTKASRYRQQALEIAAQSGVEGSAYADIALAADPKVRVFRPAGSLTGIELFGALKFAAPLPQLATAAIKESNWAMLAFLIQEAQERKLLNEGELAAARGLSLMVAGAQAESLPELQTAVGELSDDSGALLMPALVLARYGSGAKDATKAAVEAFIDKTDWHSRRASIRPEYAVALADAAIWSGAEVSERVRSEIAALAATSARRPARAAPAGGEK